MKLEKFPRTRHIQGSRLQSGDLGDDQAFADLAGRPLIITEKLDGANCGISFGRSGALLLQSRGHYLTGGGRERHFDLFKTWAYALAHRLWPVLQNRYVLYGEWLYAKHTVFYDCLPHYFLEFDVLDRERGHFLSTQARRALLAGLPIMPVPRVFAGALPSLEALQALVQPSSYRSPDWRRNLLQAAEASGSRADLVQKQTDDSDLAEGLYVRLEQGDSVRERFKFVRGSFTQAIESAEGHWLDRPILPNRLAQGSDIFVSSLGIDGAYDASAV